jgi:glycosyltransferase involved in cell wall biosynthesis
MRRPIIVLIPVKNEEWILSHFLRATEQFADLIIVADQNSTDHSRDICRNHDKVCLIDNPNPDYDEAFRQQLLLAEARRQVPTGAILLALDVDEILTADSLHIPEWENLHTAPLGTSLFFEKPDILHPPELCRRSSTPFLLGFIDDGSPHTGDLIHSRRLPVSSPPRDLVFKHIKFMHLAMTRPQEYWDRQHLYSVLENINNSKTLRQRVGAYSERLQRRAIYRHAVPTPVGWTDGWTKLGLSLRELPSSATNSYCRRVLEAFARFGTRRFFFDDIWARDWEAARQQILAEDPQSLVPRAPLAKPGIAHRLCTRVLIVAIQRWRTLQRHKD